MFFFLVLHDFLSVKHVLCAEKWLSWLKVTVLAIFQPTEKEKKNFQPAAFIFFPRVSLSHPALFLSARVSRLPCASISGLCMHAMTPACTRTLARSDNILLQIMP